MSAGIRTGGEAVGDGGRADDAGKPLRWRETLGVVVFGAVCVLVGVPVSWTDSSGRLTVLYAVAAVALLDVVLLVLAATRASRRAAVVCGVVGLAAALVQAIWVTIPFFSTFLTTDSAAWLWFVTAPVVALMLAVGLFVRRASRKYGLAVLIGSAEGFFGMFVFLVLAFAAAIGAD